MSNNNYFAGLEEAVARLLSFIVSLAFFSIYILSKSQITLDWNGLLIHVTLFWLVYELIAMALFYILSQFSKAKKLSNKEKDPNSTTGIDQNTDKNSKI